MAITTLPPAPSRATDTPAAFATKSDAWLAAQAQFVTDVNNTEANMVAQASIATAQAGAATGQALQAASSAASAAQALAAAQAVSGATKWVSGTAYGPGLVVWSPTNGQNYRSRTSMASSTVDPANDPTNWFALLLQQSLPVVVVSASGTTVGSANVHYVITGTGVNLQMPTSPNPGDLFGITNASGSTANTLDPNGKALKGDSSVMSIDDLNASAILKFTISQGWIKQ